MENLTSVVVVHVLFGIFRLLVDLYSAETETVREFHGEHGLMAICSGFPCYQLLSHQYSITVHTAAILYQQNNASIGL